MTPLSWQLYIIQSLDGKLYTGITNNLARRLQQHALGKQGAKFFRTSPAWQLVFCTPCADRSQALQWEYQIKQLSRRDKLELIGQPLAQPDTAAQR